MKINLTGVAETLLITLHARVRDAQKPKGFLKDQMSVEIAQKLNITDWDKYKGNFLTYNGTIGRLVVMDREVRKFLDKYPKATIISIGSGLDTRFWRVDNGQCEWYDVDFPEVIELRKQLLPKQDRVHNISCSALEPTWTSQVTVASDSPLLIFSEGVVMYFEEAQVKELLKILCDNFAKFTLHLDLMYIGVVKWKQDKAIEQLGSPFKWGVTDGHEVVALEPRLKQLALVSFNKAMSAGLNWWQYLCFLYIRKMNNRLGVYEYDAKKL